MGIFIEKGGSGFIFVCKTWSFGPDQWEKAAPGKWLGMGAWKGFYTGSLAIRYGFGVDGIYLRRGLKKMALGLKVEGYHSISEEFH